MLTRVSGMMLASVVVLLAAQASATRADPALGAAKADRPADAPRAANDDAPPPQDWRALGYLGGFGNVRGESDGGGMTLGASFQYRVGPLVGGVVGETGGEILGYGYTGMAALGGVGLRPVRAARIQLLGEIGHHFYTGVGRDWLFGSDPGASGSTPYAGGRMNLSHVFGKQRGHFELGAYLGFQNDLSRKRVVYDYPATGDGWFHGGGTGDHVVGFSRLAGGVEIGGTGDLF